MCTLVVRAVGPTLAHPGRVVLAALRSVIGSIVPAGALLLWVVILLFLPLKASGEIDAFAIALAFCFLPPWGKVGRQVQDDAEPMPLSLHCPSGECVCDRAGESERLRSDRNDYVTSGINYHQVLRR